VPAATAKPAAEAPVEHLDRRTPRLSPTRVHRSPLSFAGDFQASVSRLAYGWAPIRGNFRYHIDFIKENDGEGRLSNVAILQREASFSTIMKNALERSWGANGKSAPQSQAY
jgi:hypothetical protein